MIPPRPVLLVAALGLTQIIGYGTLYYAFPVLVPAIAPEFGVSEPLLFGIFSAGYLLGGLVAPTLGGWLDRIGAAQVMTRGSLVIALLLGLLAAAPNILTFGALAILIEIISFTVLYDAAFAVLAQKRPADTRRAITGLTLIAGFASTIFWPRSAALLEGLGWRGTFGLFAAAHLLCALVHQRLGTLAPDEAAPAPEAEAEAATPAGPEAPAPRPSDRTPDLAPALARRAFALLAAGFALSGMAITALTVHLVAILQSLAPGEGAYLAAMVMGPAQVVVRIVDATAWRARHPLFVALVSAAAIVGAVALHRALRRVGAVPPLRTAPAPTRPAR